MASSITSLALEGGGGKGNAYLGCIHALQSYGLLNGITEYAGTSAGAITAFLLSMGHSYEEIKGILTTQDFNEFFDIPDITREITLSGAKYRFGRKLSREEIKVQLSQRSDFISFTLKHSLIDSKLIDIILRNFNLSGLTKSNPFLGERLTQYFSDYITQLVVDFGLFSGAKVLTFFEKLSGGLTFSEHHKKYKNTLRLIASDFQGGQMQVFSWKTTPNFPVALAVRMSMSLPLIYKPVRITRKDIELNPKYKSATDEEKQLVYGVWVDGGIFDNAPVRYSSMEQTLLLRLGRRYDFALIEDITELITRWASFTMMGGVGSGQVTKSTFPQNRIIQLDTTGTDLLKFSLTPTELEEVEKRNYSITEKFILENKYMPEENFSY